MNLKMQTLSAASVAVLIVIIVAVNVIASRLHFRMDLTEDNIYSLSEGTERILEKIDGQVILKFYFSRSNKSLPPVIKTYATRVEEVLGEYVSLSGGQVMLEVFDPRPDTEDEVAALGYGLRRLNLPSGDDAFFGLAILKGSKETAVPYIDPRREEFLEYDISAAIQSLQTSDRPKIGVLSSLNVLGGSPSPANPHGGGGWVAFEQLRKNFSVEAVAPNAETIGEDIKILMLVHPKNNIEPKTLYAIDQYVMNGGRLVVLLDPFSRIDLATQRQMMAGRNQMPRVSSDLKPMLNAYGIKYDASKMVGDSNRMLQVNAGGAPIPYPYVFQVRKEQLAKDSVVTERLNMVLISEGGWVAADGETKIQPLAQTTDASGVGEAGMAAFMPPRSMASKFQQQEGAKTVVGLLSAKFKSAFAAGPPEGVINSNHLAEAAFSNSILVFADLDFIYDDNAVQKLRFGPQTIIRPTNDNLNLFLNAIEYMGGSEDLISIRSSGRIARPFTKLEEIQRRASERWQKKEEQLSARLKELQTKLSQLQNSRADGGRFTLTNEQQTEISRFRQEEIQLRKDRREVRKNLREDIENLGVVLTFLNLFVVPAGVGAFGIGVFVMRAQRNKRSKPNE